MAETGWVNMSHSKSEGTAWQMNLSYETSFDTSAGTSSITINYFQVRRQVSKSYNSSSDGDVKCWVTSDSWSTYNTPTWPNFTVSKTAWEATGWQWLGGYSRTGLNPSSSYSFVIHWDDVTAATSMNWDATCTFSITAAAKTTYYLDLNGNLDGSSSGNIANYGTAKVTVNGVVQQTSCTDYYTAWAWGSTYSIVVTPNSGKVFSDGTSAAKTYSGTIKAAVNVTPALRSTYAVTYNANGGSGAPSSQTKVYGNTLTLSSTIPTQNGFTFSKWNTKADGSGTSYSSGASYTGNSALALYAIWSHKPIQINVSGTWKNGYPWINVSGTWKQAKCVWVNVNGTWKPMK